ncbi:transcription factor, contains a PHD finger motif [Diatrype stigma]|uniref:Transcription factor, contains a PHD finger motif n=1 Tax=Diatrype stigma TaxID=117547 RepID=A0AAN9UTI5_9PEZI
MAPDAEVPERKVTPVPVPVLPISALPQKRPLEDDHAPPVSSPLNPNLDVKLPRTQSHDDIAAMGREKPARTKKESLKKRESKVGFGGGDSSSRATPDPKIKDIRDLPPSEASPLRYKLAPPKPSDFEPARGPIFTHHHDITGLDGSTIQFYETSEHVYNKKSFHYLHCIADPAFPSSFYYRQTEPPPYGPHISFEDAATHMYMDQSGRHITTDKGFRMARANVAVRQGRWYWECKITRGTVKGEGEGGGDGKIQSHGHVRLGFARREASLDAPVGFDAYSYGIRDVQGQKVHMSRPKDFFPPGEDIKEGDVIGLEIQLPSEHLHRKVVSGHYNPAVDLDDEDDEATAAAAAEAANIVRDRIPIRFKAHIYFEKIDYHTTKELEDLMNPTGTAGGPGGGSGGAGGAGGGGSTEPPNPIHPVPAMRTLPGSCIRVYKNGVLMGTPFTDLLAFLPPASRPQAQVGAREGMDDGMLGYYPALSVFRGGAAEVNFGPDFWYPPPDYAPSTNTTDATANGAAAAPTTTTTTTTTGSATATAAAAAAAAAAEDDGDVDMTGVAAAADHSAKKEEAGGDDDDDGDNAGWPPSLSLSLPRKTNDRLRAVAERYDEQIVEDVVADMVDEVDFWMQDGARVIDRTGGRDAKAAEAPGGFGIAPVSREEIKEIVQDD